MANKYLRTLRHIALRDVLREGRKQIGVKQRPLAAELERSQPSLSLMETGQRACDVLEFVDIGDSLYEDRLALYKALVNRVPRVHHPSKTLKRAAAARKGRTPPVKPAPKPPRRRS